jgi:hypothetical protein
VGRGVGGDFDSEGTSDVLPTVSVEGKLLSAGLHQTQGKVHTHTHTHTHMHTQRASTAGEICIASLHGIYVTFPGWTLSSLCRVRKTVGGSVQGTWDLPIHFFVNSCESIIKS